MRRSTKTWIFFSFGAAVVLGVMVYVSVRVSAEEKKARLARSVTAHQEKERAALWRLDSALAPILANETGRAIAAMAGITPLSSAPPSFFRLFFSQDVEGNLKGFAATPNLTSEQERTIGLLDLESVKAKIRADHTWDDPENQDLASNFALLNASNSSDSEWDRNDDRIRQRNQMLSNLVNPATIFVPANFSWRSLMPFVGYWLKVEGADILLLSRPGGESDIFQFALVDWDELRLWMTTHIADLLPHASLEPASTRADGSSQALLTALPLRLVSKPVPPESAATLGLPLILGWGAVCLGLISIAGVLRASLLIGDRRARFVSTVTHELRTPITTFRMYSQMLADGMVTEESQKVVYLQTLKEESARIARVLESVLLYSRLEEGRAEARKSTISVMDLLDGIMVPMVRQARVHGLDLNIDFHHAQDQSLETDGQVVEQIMLNLLDNAAKYASGQSRSVELSSGVGNNQLFLELRDFGPGVKGGEEKKMFREFHRGAGSHQDGFSGLGLGLSLGRDLARGLRGDLVLLPHDGPGAKFRLILPLT